MKDKRFSVIRPTDDEALRLARRLARGSRFAAIAVLEPATGHPFSSRVLLGNDVDGVPVMLSSTLSTHTRAILEDPRCSILVGEPGRGDPLAWPRLTMLAEAERIEPGSESHSHIRGRFLRRHPKARLYIDFADFSFFRLVPKSASLNGGFGKAYNILGSEFIIRSPAVQPIAYHELQLLAELNSLSERAGDLLIKRYFKEKTTDWVITAVDAAGLDLARKEQLCRFELQQTILDLNGLIVTYKDILKDIR